jgi:hypothetical protein
MSSVQLREAFFDGNKLIAYRPALDPAGDIP